MDRILARSQSELAVKQRDLATNTKLQLSQNIGDNFDEQEELKVTEELNGITRNNQFEVERIRREESANSEYPVDHICQLQKCETQVKIAERQVQVAQRQLEIAVGHVENGSGTTASYWQTAQEFRQKAESLLLEATELLKQARHSMAFKELGARQRLHSQSPTNNTNRMDREGVGFESITEHPQPQIQTHPLETNESFKFSAPHNREVSVIGMGAYKGMERSYEDTQRSYEPNFRPTSPPTTQRPWSQSHSQFPILDPTLLTPQTRAQQIPTTNLSSKKSSGCGPCIWTIVVLIILLIAGGGGFALYHFVVKGKIAK